jgi:hypothetical protein
MQSSAQSATQERQSGRQSSTQSMQSSAQSQQDERQQSWQSHGQQQQQSRQSYATQHQQSWQSYGQQQQENRQNWADDYHGGCCYHGYGYSSGGAFAAGALTGLALGTVITAAQFNASAAAKTPVVVNNVTYYQVGSTWYQPQYQGGQPTYVVVNPPQQAPTTVVVPPPPPPQPGAMVPGGGAAPAYVMGNIYPTLPAGCISPTVQGKTYYLCGNTWFEPSYGASGVSYRVVPTP